MKKALTILALATLCAAPSFAAYIVVLKDGTKYAAKQKWTVVNGKAIVQLENGQSLQLDPALIDVARSEQMTKVGMANANILDLNANLPKAQPKAQPSLGSQIKLRQRPQQGTQPATPAVSQSAPPPIANGTGTMSAQVIDKFQRAYENVGIFEHKVVGTSARGIRAELTVDTEERVFNAISATSFLMVRNAGVEGAQIEMVELFMKTTTGGAAGRFQMSREDAEALDKRTILQQDYFIRKVIY
ncbi:MAG TPA: hypothetical protein VEK11_20260 [Thermoanaerobaculia bacterium]|jgi:hypothetical protein|nr:hypothetical protein [Thermoanaerobaculia bacterium]